MLKLSPFKKTAAPDMQLWINFQQSESEALREIYERYCDMLLKYGQTIVNDREFIKDCIQDLFIYLWQRRHQLAAVKSVKFYLLISFRRMVLVKNKKELKKQLSFKLMALSDTENYERPMVDQMADKETAEWYKNLLARNVKHLPMRQQQAIFLRFYKGLEYDEIGKIMNLDYQVLRNTVYRAIKTLQAKIEATMVNYSS